MSIRTQACGYLHHLRAAPQKIFRTILGGTDSPVHDKAMLQELDMVRGLAPQQ